MSAERGVSYAVDGAIARIVLDRPERGNALTAQLLGELGDSVERATRLAVRVLVLSGSGAGFCGGYDLVESAEGTLSERPPGMTPGSPIDPAVISANHDPSRPGTRWSTTR